MWTRSVNKSLDLSRWGLTDVLSININESVNEIFRHTYVTLCISNKVTYESIQNALKNIQLYQKDLLKGAYALSEVDCYSSDRFGSYKIRFDLGSLSKADIERILTRISHLSATELPLDQIKQGLAEIIPDKSSAELKIILAVAATIATAGAAYWGYQKISEYLASNEKDNCSWMTLYQPKPAEAREVEEPSLFHSFGMGAE